VGGFVVDVELGRREQLGHGFLDQGHCVSRAARAAEVGLQVRVHHDDHVDVLQRLEHGLAGEAALQERAGCQAERGEPVRDLHVPVLGAQTLLDIEVEVLVEPAEG
jgi:hypothetical protein